MIRRILLLAFCQLLYIHGEAFQIASFQLPVISKSTSTSTSTTTTTLYGKSRKARKQQNVERQTSGRAKQFYDAIEDAQGKKTDKKTNNKKPDDDEELDPREKYLQDAQEQYEKRPKLSTTFVDEETGIEVIAQGQSVMDVVTRKAVKLSDLGPEYRLAQMFPGVPPDIRAKYRADWNTITVPELLDQLREACYVKLEDGSRGIPKHPSVANKAIDFVLANRDILGYRMKRLLPRLQMRAMWKGDKEEALELEQLSKHFWTLENYISGPFRQILQDAEGRVGPNFGNLDLMKYCNGELYERVGNYIALKGMVAHWEKKVVDADFVEKTPQTDENFMSVLLRGDPKRYLPEPPILFTLKECTQVCYMAQTMCKDFVENEVLFADFPPEIVFLEDALKIKGGTALRQYMIEEFCPQRGITPEGLREGMRRLYQQLENMQVDPYGDLTNKVLDLHSAMAVATEDERDPYTDYLANPDPNGPGYFQTYTFNHDKLSLVRFFDNQYPSSSSSDVLAPPTVEEVKSGLDIGNLFNLGGGGRKEKILRTEPEPDKNYVYKVPEERAAGRPHNLGWLDLLDGERGEQVRLGQVPAGRIIPDEEC